MAAATVTKRQIFYIPGFDPHPPRRYRELYRTESARQAAISGFEIAMKPRKGERFGWQVDACIDGGATTSEIEVLVWSDIVRRSMGTAIGATYWQLVHTAWIYMATGTLWRLMRLRKGPIIAALYPVAMLLAQLLVALAAGLGLSWLAAIWVPLALAVVPGVVLAWLLLRWFRARDNRLFAYYLMHDYYHSARHRGATPPDMRARLAVFEEAIAGALTGDADEVLVVGHSSGAHLAVSILANLIRQGRVPKAGPRLSFLSLGQVIPMVSFLPRADSLRADLHYLSQRDELTWVDITAPGDGCAFALCDPVGVSGVSPANQRWPLVLSAAFTQTLSPETWKALRWRFFRLHFQYLCAFDRPGDYDYFRITAGPQTLAQRFDGRKPSDSRIVDPVSRYTSMAA